MANSPLTNPLSFRKKKVQGHSLAPDQMPCLFFFATGENPGWELRGFIYKDTNPRLCRALSPTLKAFTYSLRVPCDLYKIRQGTRGLTKGNPLSHTVAS